MARHSITPVKDETEEQITTKTKNFFIKNLGFEERKVNEELDEKQKMENNPQLCDSNLTHFELPSMPAETTYKTRKN